MRGPKCRVSFRLAELAKILASSPAWKVKETDDAARCALPYLVKFADLVLGVLPPGPMARTMA